MPLMIDGKWDETADPQFDKSGAFVRTESRFRSWITADGSAGPSGEAGFKAERGRYHLFVAQSCPWAHRTAIFRRIKKLDDVISISYADAPKAEGWCYTKGLDDMKPRADGIFRLHQVYTAAEPRYTGKVTVPTLWDRERRTIVNNESSEIIRMLNGSFGAFTDELTDYNPAELRAVIDETNAFVYDHINNGVYRTGFAKTQEAYNAAVAKVFHGLDTLEARLAKQRYLAGNWITEADWRAFPTLLRFDPVYHGHFKCNLRRIVDYPSLADYTRELYQWPGVKQTVDFAGIKAGYYATMPHINPTRVVPAGPEMSWTEAKHNRDRLSPRA